MQVTEFMAKAMIEYDKNNPDKTWLELAEVAYNAAVVYLMLETERIANE